MRVHPLFQGHHIYFPEELADTPDMKELLEELGGITYTGLTAKADDGVDLVSMIPLLDLQKPSAEDMLSTELDVVEQGHDGNWYYPEDTNEWGSGGGSTVF